MAPRKPSDISSEGTPPPLKAKTEKSKIEKAKIDKPKVMKTKKEKGEGGPMEKPKALKKEKVVADDETKDKSEKPEKKVIKRKAEGEGKKDAGCAAKDGKDGKVKPVTGEEACELIINYLKEQNRPYGATDVSANLHGKVRTLLSAPYLPSAFPTERFHYRCPRLDLKAVMHRKYDTVD